MVGMDGTGEMDGGENWRMIMDRDDRENGEEMDNERISGWIKGWKRKLYEACLLGKSPIKVQTRRVTKPSSTPSINVYDSSTLLTEASTQVTEQVLAFTLQNG
jgi:hypothetical protein